MTSTPASKTVLAATRALMRDLGLTTVFGNPGSTEQPFLKHWPSDFTYVLGLQEASVIAMADGWSRAMHRSVLVNIHTAAGVGNAMGNLMTAWHNKTPMIVTAGQQTREMLLHEPFLTNTDATTLPRPYVKLALETARAEDAPAALLRAHALAAQPPTGPVFVSFPLDDWDKPAGRPVAPRLVATRLAASETALRPLAAALAEARNPVLVLGAGVTRSQGWDDAMALAEKLRCAVVSPPLCEAASFPEDHALYQGMLPAAIGPLCKALEGHDLVLVIGAPAFRYYPYVPGDYLPSDTRLVLLTDDPAEAARAPMGDSILTDPAEAICVLAGLLDPSSRTPPKARAKPQAPPAAHPMTPDVLFHALAEARPAHAVVVNETPSNMAALVRHWPALEPDSYYFPSSGGLGYGLPAAVGVALAERQMGRNRPVLAFIGDGSLQYSIQALWTAAHLELPLVVVVPDNREYAILKSFALLENTPEVPGLDLPGLDIVSIARGYGCTARAVETPDDAKAAMREALGRAGPTVIVASVFTEAKPLM